MFYAWEIAIMIFFSIFWRKDITLLLKAAVKAANALKADIKSCYEKIL